MDDKAKAKRNAYMKEWRKKNKEKVKVIQEKYWDRKALKSEIDIKSRCV